MCQYSAIDALEESIAMARRMRDGGLDLLNVSINVVIRDVEIPWSSLAFMARPAERVRREAQIPWRMARWVS
jgi:hypothetical protein